MAIFAWDHPQRVLPFLILQKSDRSSLQFSIIFL